MRIRQWIIALMVISFCAVTIAQDPSSALRSTVIQLAASAFHGNSAFTQASLVGRARSIQGSLIEDGTINLTTSADGAYQIDYQFSGGVRTETQTSPSQSDPSCSWTDVTGTSHPTAQQNCLLGVAWFLPELGMFGGIPSAGATLSLAGIVSENEGSYLDLRSRTNSNNSPSAALMTHLSTIDLLLSADTYLPCLGRYMAHPDANSNVDIPVEIQFTDYRQVSGLAIPFRIQRFFNGTLVLDITIETATVQ